MQVAAQAEEIAGLQSKLKENGQSTNQLEKGMTDLKFQVGIADLKFRVPSLACRDFFTGRGMAKMFVVYTGAM